jgi:ATP-dependent Clp protease ATP-binding subunit ClpA
MKERFSDRARHAMALANREANTLNHDYLSPAHLVLGLVAEGQCVAAETLRVLDVNLEAVRSEVHACLEAGKTNGGTVGRRAHTKEMKAVMETAIKEARKFGHPYVGTEHLLLGVLQQEDSVASKALRSQGLDTETIREKALAVLRSDVNDEHDLAHSRHGEFEWVHQQELAKAFRSPTFWHTLILAVDSANRLGAGEVQPTHLLLALLRDPSNPVSEMLSEKGVTADWVREKLAAQSDA